MSDKSESGGQPGHSALQDLDIPTGSRPRPKNDFVAAVEQRAALQHGGDPSGRSSRPRRKSGWLLPTVIGGLVILIIAMVAGIVFMVSNQDRTPSGGTEVVSELDSTSGDQDGSVGVDSTDQEGSMASDTTDETADTTGGTDQSATENGIALEFSTGQDGSDSSSTASVKSETAETQTSAATEPEASQTSDDDSQITISEDDDQTEAEILIDQSSVGGTDTETAAQATTTDETTIASADESEQAATANTDETAQEAVAETLPEPEEVPASTQVDDTETQTAAADRTTAEEPEAAAVVPVEQLPVVSVASHQGPRVQLAAYGTADRAQAGWAEIKPQLGGIESGHDVVIEEAILDSGTFYRLQIGYFDTALAARDFCDQVLTLRLDCIIIPF
jgi:hypothetical protein